MDKLRYTRRVRKLTAATVALAFIGVGAAATSASADTPSDGLWYYDKFHVKEAHDAGWTGKGVTIAVIDTAIYPELPTLQGSNLEIVEPSVCKDEGGKYLPATSSDVEDAGHGTNVAAYIIGNGRGYSGQAGIKGVAPGATVQYYAAKTDAVGVSLACGVDDSTDKSTGVTAAFRKATDNGADIISMSVGGAFNSVTTRAVSDAVRKGVIIVAAVPNQDDSIAGFPQGANGAVGVQAIDSSARVEMTDGVQHESVNVKIAGPGVGVRGQGMDNDWKLRTIQGGTSYATPIVAGFLADVMQKYPKATSNQILQSMIRTTGASLHEPERDNLTGYGVISLTEMLKTDPTRFPDVNPLVTKDESARPTWEQIYGKASSSPSTATESPGDTGKPSSGTAAPAAEESSNGLMVAGIAIGAVVLIAGLIVIVIVGIRASRNRAPRA